MRDIRLSGIWRGTRLGNRWPTLQRHSVRSASSGAPHATRLRPRLPWVMHARAPRGARRRAAGTGRAGWGGGEPLGAHGGKPRERRLWESWGDGFKPNCQRPEVSRTQETHRRYMHVAPETTRDVGGMRRPLKRFLA